VDGLEDAVAMAVTSGGDGRAMMAVAEFAALYVHGRLDPIHRAVAARMPEEPTSVSALHEDVTWLSCIMRDELLGT
jgi:hypothetical protein